MDVEELIEETFKKAVKMASENDSSIDKNAPRLVYPTTRSQNESDDKTNTEPNDENDSPTSFFRLSEQEIKQLFIETLIEDKENNFYFSVETPTKFRYKFSQQDKNGKRVTIDPLVYFSEDTNGESANIDLCLHKIENSIFIRKHLIEFKANPPDEHAIKKDFLKLFVEKTEQKTLNNYFIHILDSANSGTLQWPPKDKKHKKSIIEKYYHSWEYCCTKKTINAKNTITIYLLIIHNQTINKTERKPSSDPAPSGFYRIILKPIRPQKHNNLQLGKFCIIKDYSNQKNPIPTKAF